MIGNFLPDSPSGKLDHAVALPLRVLGPVGDFWFGIGPDARAPALDFERAARPVGMIILAVPVFFWSRCWGKAVPRSEIGS